MRATLLIRLLTQKKPQQSYKKNQMIITGEKIKANIEKNVTINLQISLAEFVLLKKGIYYLLEMSMPELMEAACSEEASNEIMTVFLALNDMNELLRHNTYKEV